MPPTAPDARSAPTRPPVLGTRRPVIDEFQAQVPGQGVEELLFAKGLAYEVIATGGQNGALLPPGREL